jgi:RND family efflux transporter MFP subunit
VKPPVRNDYGGSERTDPGGEVADDSDAPPDEAIDDEDSFPSEATRIDARAGGGAVAGRSAPAKAAAAKAPAAAAKSSPAAKAVSSQNKLKALQSLSLDGGAQSKVPPASRAQQGGGSNLPWILLALVVAGLGGNWAYQKYRPNLGGLGTLGGGEKADPSKPQIRIETVSPSGGSGQVHMAAGYIAAKTPITISAVVGGRIRDIKVNAGDKIKLGQLLVQLDDSAARAELVAVSAELSAASSTYSTKKNLLKIGAATPVDVAAASGAVSIAHGKMAPIKQRIEQARINAPINATVLERLAQPGETINTSAPVMRIADLTQLVAEADIVEADLVKIHRGQQVKVTSDVAADRSYDGVVDQIAQQADKARGTVQVKVALVVPDLSLKPGNSVKCAFQPEKNARPRIFISRTALNPQHGVWMVGADGRVSQRAVTTGASEGTSVEVTTGLNAGDRIVTDATQAHEGQQIQ